jgi:magnesium-protoporphyrin IX monomethyl ester (oxidative) cyclase
MNHPATVYKPDLTRLGVIPPLGLAYLASYLEANGGFKVRIFDVIAESIGKPLYADNKMIRCGLSDAEISFRIISEDPDVIGISCMYTAYAHDAHKIAALAKSINPNIVTVMGGAHVSISPEMCIRDKNVDVVVVGEGEVTFLELIEKLERKKDISSIRGTVVRVDEKIIRNEPRPYIEDLDSVPFPARHLLPMDIYFREAVKSPFLMRTPATAMITSRGCLGNCVFCSIHSVWGHKWRGRSASNVVDEIEFLIDKYNIREVAFGDDNVAASKKRMETICDEIIRRKLDIKWATPNGIAHWTLNKNLLKKMKKSGCYRLTFGIESGNIKTREFIGWKKSFDLDQAKEIIKYSNKIGLWTIATFILGFPYENSESINDTINYAIKSDVDFAAFYLLNPFPGTKVYDMFRKEGLVNFDDILSSENPTIQQLSELGAALAQNGCNTKYFTLRQLREYLTLAYSSFMKARFKSFLNPLRLFRKIKSKEDMSYVLKVGRWQMKFFLEGLTEKKFNVQMITKERT